jgi:diacylglycerol kinase (ATP)
MRPTLLEEVQRKIKIIVNPNAGGGKTRKLFPLLRQKLLERNLSFHLQFSENADHVTYLAQQAQGEGYNFIVACGGDGTTHRVLQTLIGKQGILGIIPLGRGNDFPRNLGIQEDVDFACNLLQNGKIRKIDVIQVNSDLVLAGVGGIGLDSEVSALAGRLNRFLSGKTAYILPALLKGMLYRPKQVLIQTDQETRQGPALMVAFGNIKSYGRGMQITPLAEPDDGLLDVCWIDPVKKIRLYRFFPTVYSGEHIDLPEVHYYRTPFVRVESPVPLDFYGAGEFLCKTPFTLRILPQALRVLVP